MAFDGIMTRAVAGELNDSCAAGRISKIYQPSEHDIVVSVRGKGKNHKLLISANPSFPRIHLTEETYVNPLEPPMFCMLLRKHCEGGIIESIRQVDMDRTIEIDLKTRNELGDIALKRIVVELMGRHSNIILIDPERNLILDGIHHITPAVSQYRQVLPGKEYIPPPAQNKRNPLDVDKETFISGIDYNQGKLDRQLVQRYTGISPLIAKEILHRAGLAGREKLWEAFADVMDAVRRRDYRPQIYRTDDQSNFSVIPLSHLQGAETESFASVSACLEAYYAGRAERAAVKQKVNDLIKRFSNEKSKNEKKIKKLLAQKKDAQKAETYKLYGELLTAYMHEVRPGDKEARVRNYYEEEMPEIVIPLNPAKSPAENAQHYYKKYNKLVKSLTVIDEQVRIAYEENDYFDRILQQLEDASLEDLEDIREELIEQGYLKDKKKKDRRKKKNAKPSPERYVSSEGIALYVGKNNRQNEYLTMRFASPQDTWLHTKDIPGSHVLIKAADFGETTLKEAAMLAAYFSKAKESSQVPVDYTLIKHVRKPKGAKPGYVIYDNQKTLYVTPDQQAVRRLKKTEEKSKH